MKSIEYKICCFLLLLISTFSCSNQEIVNEKKKEARHVFNVQAERDFKKLDSIKSYFCDYPQECAQYENGTFLFKRRFEDRVTKNRMQLSESFLDSYPNDPRYYEVLKIYLNMFSEPFFVATKIPDSLMNFLDKNSENHLTFLKQARVLPIDSKAQKRWIVKSYALAEEFLNSEATEEQKLEIEIALLARDFRVALNSYQNLPVQKTGREAEFWKRLETHYWESFRLRMLDLIEKYSNLEVTADYLQQFVSLIALHSPHLAQPYWEDFLQFADNHDFSKSIAFEKIKNMASDNLNAFEHIDLSKPLDLQLTTFKGNKIDLNKLKGKVILLDFWTISCGPCIKEMPHLQDMYEKYKDRGFEVIGIAGESEKEKEQVLKLIKRQGVTYPQVFDKTANVSYHTLFKIKFYPSVWLLNKEGIVVDKNARGQRLEPLIRKLLNIDK